MIRAWLVRAGDPIPSWLARRRALWQPQWTEHIDNARQFRTEKDAQRAATSHSAIVVEVNIKFEPATTSLDGNISREK